MSNGRHFNPPTPAYRPRDPFSPFVPRLAENVPSCEMTRPLPSRPRPVRMDGRSEAPPEALAEARQDRGGGPAPPQPAPGAGVEAPPGPIAPPQRADGGLEAHGREVEQRVAPLEPAKESSPEDSRSTLERVQEPHQPQEPQESKKRRSRAEARPAKKTAKAARAARASARGRSRSDQAELAVGPGEEVRICEWEKCRKKFVVKATGRTNVRRFCSGTCRGRASEARTGKR